MDSPRASAAYTLFVGIDSAATTATAAWTADQPLRSRPLTFMQTAQGYTSLQDQLRATGHPAAQT